jgi:CRISPR/Cas system-associated exonuclease Cas4 (RecB family)
VTFVGPWTHSRLSSFETCKLRFKLKEIDKVPEAPSPALERGSKIHEHIEGYLNGWVKTLPEEIKLRDELKKLKALKPVIEKLWAHAKDYSPITDQWSKAAWCRAKLDAFLETNARARVIDFKTGRVYPQNDDQVRFYGMLGLMRAPKQPLAQLELWYVDQDLIKECEPVKRTEIPLLQKEYTRRAERMYKPFKPTPEPGLHCRTCPFRKQSGGPCEY